MDERDYAEFDFAINEDEPLFVISVVSEMVNIPVWTLRKLDDKGIVRPTRLGKKTRCYTKNQIKKLTYIYHLMEHKGVNIKGIQVIMEMSFEKEKEDDRHL